MNKKTLKSILIIALSLFLSCSFTMNAAVTLDKEKVEKAKIGLAKLLAYMEWAEGQLQPKEHAEDELTESKRMQVSHIKRNAHQAWHRIGAVQKDFLENKDKPQFNAIFEKVKSQIQKTFADADWDKKEKEALDDIENAKNALIELFG